jgi:signal transduction histidine kinase
MLSIKLKIVIAYTLLFGLLLSLFAYIIYRSTEKANIARLDARLKSYAVLLQSEIEEQYSEAHHFNIAELKAVPSDRLKLPRFQVFDDEGNVILGDTIIAKPDMNLVQSLLNGSDKFRIYRLGRRWSRIYYSPLELEEKTNHILLVSSSLEELHEDLENLQLLFFIIIPLALLLAGLSAYLIAKKAFKPVNDIIATANEISASSLNKRLDIPVANDEVKALSLTLNSMIERLDKTFRSHRQFIANASHELRTPLTIVQTELELSLKKIKDEQASESIKISINEIEKLGRLTNSLLTLVKIDVSKSTLEKNNVRLDELILECAQNLKWLAEQNKSKISILVDEVIEIEGDSDKIKSIILNLLENAIKYSGESREVKIELKQAGHDFVNIIVSDNGEGINEKNIPYLFERFYRSDDTRSSIDGNGLGLAIVKEFVDMHSGKIDVKSRPGETVFTVKLPLMQII